MGTTCGLTGQRPLPTSHWISSFPLYRSFLKGHTCPSTPYVSVKVYVELISIRPPFLSHEDLSRLFYGRSSPRSVSCLRCVIKLVSVQLHFLRIDYCPSIDRYSTILLRFLMSLVSVPPFICRQRWGSDFVSWVQSLLTPSFGR